MRGQTKECEPMWEERACPVATSAPACSKGDVFIKIVHCMEKMKLWQTEKESF
jgi:hypothetical protein